MSIARSSRIPSAIQPCLELPHELTLVLLTGTLGCSPNWLTALFVDSVIGSKPPTDNAKTCSTIFISWMRDLSFWTDEIRRTAGLDVAKLSQQGTFTFLDYLNPRGPSETKDPLSSSHRAVKDAIQKASSNSTGKTLLVLDNPDVLLATQSTTAQELNKFIMELRTLTYSTIISCSADSPLVAAADQHVATKTTPIEIDTASFVTQQAHNADLVMSVHELSSGAAKDISGTLRITRGGEAAYGDGNEVDIPAKEMLYLVQRDGTVKVFVRGEGNM